MASYIYECSACNMQKTVDEPMTDEHKQPVCEICHHGMNRVWNTPSITFVGSGFYSTDNKKIH